MTEQERKNRIKEIRAELRELQAPPRSDWHTAFEAFLRLQTFKYKGVVIRTEVEIGIDPPRTDFLILTGDTDVDFKESIFKLFRRINVIEYKNPDDALNERALYKACGYAQLLIGTAIHEGDVPIDQVTVTIFRTVKNPRLFSSLGKKGMLAKTETPGIYRVTGITMLPFQIVITSELEGTEYAACRALTGKASATDIEQVIGFANSTSDETMRNYYRIMLYLIAEKNMELFSHLRRIGMNKDALFSIMKDDIDELLDERMRQERLEADARLQQADARLQQADARLQQADARLQQADARLQQERQEANERLQQERQEADERRQKERQQNIKNIMDAFGVTIDKAMDILRIPQTERRLYSSLLQNT